MSNQFLTPWGRLAVASCLARIYRGNVDHWGSVLLVEFLSVPSYWGFFVKGYPTLAVLCRQEESMSRQTVAKPVVRRVRSAAPRTAGFFLTLHNLTGNTKPQHERSCVMFYYFPIEALISTAVCWSLCGIGIWSARHLYREDQQ